MQILQPKRAAALALAAVLAAACTSADDRDDMAQQTARADTSSAGSPPESASVATNLAGNPVSDPQVAAILVAANQAEVATGQLGREKATDPRVKEFASRMATDHAAGREQVMTVLGQAAVTPQENPVSQQLRTTAESTLATLRGRSGADFDREFMAAQVTYHESLLDAIDRVLTSNADNPALKTLVGQTRTAVAAHLDQARQIQAGLEGGTGSTAAPAPQQ